MAGHQLSDSSAGPSDPVERTVASPFIVSKLEREAAKNWDIFYRRHQDRFFRDRHWTDREFQALKEAVSVAKDDDAGQDMVQGGLSEQTHPVLLEVGCGVGNMLWPLLEKTPELKVHCCDFSQRAVELVKLHPSYSTDRVNAFVYDLICDPPTLSTQVVPHPFGPPTLVSLIFVLSAIPPAQHGAVLKHLFSLVQPGGSLLFRDYAQGDLAQRRFESKEKWHEPNLLHKDYDFFRRGDGTMTFFFSDSYIRQLGQSVLDDVEESKVELVERNGENRKTATPLRRIFIQAHWRKRATK
ncbi:unnamed protein product [Parajaminaea phylloscopi]